MSKFFYPINFGGFLIHKKREKMSKNEILNLSILVSFGSIENIVEPENKEIKNLLVFEEVPNKDDVEERARTLATFASESGYKRALINGHSIFIASLELALLAKGVKPMFIYTHKDGEIHLMESFLEVESISEE
jgi:hypothetical protein